MAAEPIDTTAEKIPAECEALHVMLAGSHERPGGPECRCGAPWLYMDDRCSVEVVA